MRTSPFTPQTRESYRDIHSSVNSESVEGLVKYDTVRGTSKKYLFGAGRTSNEAPIAPRVRDEDDGYVRRVVRSEAIDSAKRRSPSSSPC